MAARVRAPQCSSADSLLARCEGRKEVSDALSQALGLWGLPNSRPAEETLFSSISGR